MAGGSNRRHLFAHFSFRSLRAGQNGARRNHRGARGRPGDLLAGVGVAYSDVD
jgi:hypothetical protein